MKGTVSKMVVRPPMMDGVLIWRQKQETKLEVAELTISRFTVECPACTRLQIIISVGQEK